MKQQIIPRGQGRDYDWANDHVYVTSSFVQLVDADRSEAGGLQFTAQQLGSSLGTAFLGAIVITGLIAAFSTKVEGNPKISAGVQQQVHGCQVIPVGGPN